MKEANPENTDDFMMFSRKMIIDGDTRHRPRPGRRRRQHRPHHQGTLRPQIRQLDDLGILPKGKVTVQQAMTTDGLP